MSKEPIDLINNKGEKIGEISLGQNEDIITKKIYTPKQKHFFNMENELKTSSYLEGGYVHMFYIKNEILFNDIGLKPNSVTRLIYLATYLNYTEKYKKYGMLVKYGENNKPKPMTRKDLKEIMKLSDTQFKGFLKELKDKSILFEMDKKYYLNNAYFCKGRVKNNREYAKLYNNYTRIYIPPIRELYNKFKPTKHKQLGYIFQLIPYMDFEDCRLINDEGYKLELYDMCEILGLSTDKDNMNKLKNEFKKMTFFVANKEYYLFARVQIGEHTAWHINPYALWSGSELETKKYIANILGLNEDIESLKLEKLEKKRLRGKKTKSVK